MSKLTGQVAVVTGASKGIGAEIARELAAAGAAVVVNYASDREGAEKVVADIAGVGGRAVAVQGNVARSADVDRIFAQAKRPRLRGSPRHCTATQAIEELRGLNRQVHVLPRSRLAALCRVPAAINDSPGRGNDARTYSGSNTSPYINGCCRRCCDRSAGPRTRENAAGPATGTLSLPLQVR